MRPTLNEVLGEFFFDEVNEEELSQNKVEVINRG